MNQQGTYQPLNTNNLETLKAASSQVTQEKKEEKEEVKETPKAPALGLDKKEERLAERFAQKLILVEKEKRSVDQEMAKIERIWSSLVEKKKQLEKRREGLVKVKDKLASLNKEMDDVLNNH